MAILSTSGAEFCSNKLAEHHAGSSCSTTAKIPTAPNVGCAGYLGVIVLILIVKIEAIVSKFVCISNGRRPAICRSRIAAHVGPRTETRVEKASGSKVDVWSDFQVGEDAEVCIVPKGRVVNQIKL